LATEEVDEGDMALAATLDAPREALAAALIKLLRGPLPAPEELADISQRAAPVAPRRHESGAVWFHCDVGRQDGADPKWLLPFLCKRGHVTRDSIGTIRILSRETQFEVAADVAHRFLEAANRAEGKDAEVRVEPMQPIPRAGPPPRSAAPERRPGKPLYPRPKPKSR